MKKILLFIGFFLLVLVHCFSQSAPDAGSNVTKRRVFTTSASGNGTWATYPSGTQISLNSLSFALLEYKPRDSLNVNGSLKKQPAIIFLHGIGERGGTSTAKWDTTTGTPPWVDDVYTLEPIRCVRRIDGSNTILGELIGKKFANPHTGDSSEFWFFAPQQWGDDGAHDASGNPEGSVGDTDPTSDYSDFGFDKWPPAYIKAIIQTIKSTPAYYNRIDTNRIYLSGLSLGGGGVLTCIADSSINAQLAAAAPSCAGYITSPADNLLGTGTSTGTYSITSAEYDMIARSGLPIWIFHATNDTQAPVDRSDTFIEQIMLRHPLFAPKYFRFSTGDHQIWTRIFRPSSWSTAYSSASNGTVRFSATGGIEWKNLFEWFLQFDTRYQRRPDL